jgi:acetolactate synthase-1/2/3 large subunit
MVNPDFVKIAEAYKIPAVQVNEREKVKSSLQEMIQTTGPYFIEVIVAKEDNVFPMVPAGAGVSEVLLEAPGDKN